MTTIPVTDAGEVVLLRRGFEPGRGWWAQPGGFLEVDETATEGAIRETEEEIGLLVEPGEILGLYARLEAAVIVLAYEARIVGRRAADEPRGAGGPGLRPRGDPVAGHRVPDHVVGAGRLARAPAPGPRAAARSLDGGRARLAARSRSASARRPSLEEPALRSPRRSRRRRWR